MSRLMAEPARASAVPREGALRHGLLVVGMHRSGTSAATRILSLLGAALPANLMPSHADFNAAGFWESLDVVALNERLLAAAQSSWDDALPLTAAELPAPALAEFAAGARAVLARDFGSSDWFVLKDPRIGRLLPPWLDVVRSVGARPLVVIPVRQPLEVAASLARRDGFSHAKSLYLCLRHLVDVVRASRGVPRAILPYDELMADWQACVQRVARDLGITWPRQPQQVAAEVEGFLDRGLRHHSAQQAGAPGGLVAERAAELYAALCRRDPGLDALADAIDAQLAPLEAVFAPLQRDAVRRVAVAHAERERQTQDLQAQRDRALAAIDEMRADLQGQRDRALAAIEEMRTDLQGQRDRAVASLEEARATLDAERAVHASVATAFEDKVRHVQVLEQDRADLEAQRDRALARIGALEGEYAAERARHVALREEFEDKVRHVQALEREIAEVRGERDLLLAERERMLAEREQLLAEREQMTAEREQMTAERGRMLAEREQLLAERDRLLAELQQLQARHAVTQDRLADLTQTLQQAREAIARIDGALSS